MPGMNRKLHLKFHGKILNQLGLETYQSPVSCLAELIANAWDADAEEVRIRLPDSIDEKGELVVEDDGIGMTFDDCEGKYLNVGWNRRGSELEAATPEKGRPVLGRKGIGKFAGFGVAKIIHVETISKDTGEKTIFELDIDKLMSEEYVAPGGELTAKYFGQDEARKSEHGTKVVLNSLRLARNISKTQFPRSIARRFLLHQRADDFKVLVDDKPIPEGEDYSKIEFVFPRDYKEEEKPENLKIDGEWGVETLPNEREIRWRVFFYKETVDEEELQGISVFSCGKLAQKPFFFNLSGGLGGQAGQSYMSGQVEANYINVLPLDPIAQERQRINWELPETVPLLKWGQERVKRLLRIWHDRRGEKRRIKLEEKVATFSPRLEKLPPHEAKTVKRVLTKLGGISAIPQQQYEDMGEAILTSWEEGRLRELISAIVESEDFTEQKFLGILVEAEVLSALNIAEAVKTKLLTIAQLKERLVKKELEAAVRDYIAEHPWIISPRWETFQVEKSLKKVIKAAAAKVGFNKEQYSGRVDLVLSSGDQLLVIEFMRPGLKLDWDHISRFERYVLNIRKAVSANTASGFRPPTGLIVADSIDEDPAIIAKIQSLGKDDMLASDWYHLLENAKKSWDEFLKILVNRGRGDERLKALVEDTES